MTRDEVSTAYAEFRIDATMSESDAMAALELLAAVVQRSADAATAIAEQDDPDGTWQKQADELEDLASELQNITIDVNTECPSCSGEGASDCPTCGGSGEVEPTNIGDSAAGETSRAVAEAFARLS